MEDRDAVAHELDFREQVARNENREPPFAREPLQELPHFPDAGRVEPVGGLVEDQHARLSEERLGDPEPLPHPERIRGDALFEPPVDPDEAREVVDLGAGPAADHRREDLEVLAAGQRTVEIRRFDDRADVSHRRLEMAREVDAADHDAARIGTDQPGQHPDRRRLAGAVRAEESEDLRFVQIEADVAKRRPASRAFS